MTLRFRPAAELWPLVDRAFQRHSREIRTLVPSAQVQHVGATSIPRSLTKGDLDLLIRVPAEAFPDAVVALRGRYAAEQPENWNETFASMGEHLDGELPVGLQLVMTGSRAEAAFLALRSLFRSRPELVQRSNELKRRFENGDADGYTRAKQEFLEGLLREADPERFDSGTWPWPG